MTCDLTLLEQPTNIPMYALDSADVREEATRVAAVAEKCGQSATAHMLPHITTWSAPTAASAVSIPHPGRPSTGALSSPGGTRELGEPWPPVL